MFITRLKFLLAIAKILFVIKHKIPEKLSKPASFIDSLLVKLKNAALDFSRQLPPFVINAEDKTIEVHTLLCKKDVSMYLWAIRSLLFYTQLNCPIVIHDDGSLDNDDIQSITESLPGIEIITRSTSELQISSILNDFPSCQYYRNKHFSTLKLFDFNLLSKADWILSFDSDILFFDKDQELGQGYKNRKKILYNKEYGNDTYHSSQQLLKKYPEIINGFNAGLFLYPKNIFVLCEVEEITSWLLENSESIMLPFFRFDDQIIFSILAGSSPSKALSSKYSTHPSSKIIENQLICKHFHSAWKDGFWLEGISALLKKNPDFLKPGIN